MRPWLAIGTVALVLACAVTVFMPAPDVSRGTSPKGDRLNAISVPPVPGPPATPATPATPAWVPLLTTPPVPAGERPEAAVASVPVEAPPARAHQRAPLDVCSARGMRKEYTRGRGGWVRWHCVR